jgi:hypothetical protein
MESRRIPSPGSVHPRTFQEFEGDLAAADVAASRADLASSVRVALRSARRRKCPATYYVVEPAVMWITGYVYRAFVGRLSWHSLTRVVPFPAESAAVVLAGIVRGDSSTNRPRKARFYEWARILGHGSSINRICDKLGSSFYYDG